MDITPRKAGFLVIADFTLRMTLCGTPSVELVGLIYRNTNETCWKK